MAFQKARSLLYKGCWGISVGVSQKGHRVSSFPSFVLLSVIVRTHYPGRQMPWESQSTNGEGKFVLKKLLISQYSVVLYFCFISLSLFITSLLVICVIGANHLYAGANFSNNWYMIKVK